MTTAEWRSLGPGDLAALHEAWEQQQRRLDYRSAVIAVLIAETNRDPKLSPRPFKMDDFFDTLAPPPPSTDELERKICAAFGV